MVHPRYLKVVATLSGVPLSKIVGAVYGVPGGPMSKMKAVSPHSLTGDLGWHLRDVYADTISDLDNYEMKTISDWMSEISADLTDRLKQPLLVAEDCDEDSNRPPVIHVNLDIRLLLLLREIHYLSQEPFNIKLTGQARELLRNTNSEELRVTATRLETTVSKYSTVMRTMTSYEQPLFERLLAKIDHLFEEGLNSYTWKTQESADFIEMANAIVNIDLHTNLDIVQTNCNEITEITMSWSSGQHDIFGIRDHSTSYSVDELIMMQRHLNEDFESLVVPSGHRIHSLLEASFKAVEISEASPAWQEYVEYIDAIVLNGLKQSSLTSLQSMLKQIVTSNMNQLNALLHALTALPQTFGELSEKVFSVLPKLKRVDFVTDIYKDNSVKSAERR
ncbi:hypothetical protein LSAT2_008579 [Lamellibrachia satsuma]|nr:hypothetical protein LSAT2_008579 [Lamellibrachia satsuma]